MRVQLRHKETNETLNLEFPDASTLHDLRLQINQSNPSSVHLSFNRNDEVLASSSFQATLRSLGVTSGDLIYFSLDPSAFTPLDQQSESASSAETQKTQISVGESSTGGKLTENANLVQQSETNQAIIPQSSVMNLDIQNQANTETNPGVEEPNENVELAGMEVVGRERLSEPLFLKKILFDESGDTCELTIVVMTVHAVMLESGFSLFNPDPGMRFSFSDELLSVSLKYTLPALINANEEHNDKVELVRLKFQKLGHMVVVYGTLGEGSLVHKVYFDKRRYVHIVDLLMETLEPNEKEEDTSSMVFMCWRKIKDGLVTPLLIDLCYKTGLEVPPCLMNLPGELKLKILKSLPGVYIARMTCVCSELRDFASDDAIWKKKCLKECKMNVTEGNDVVGTWKDMYATYSRVNGLGLLASLSSYFRRGRN